MSMKLLLTSLLAAGCLGLAVPGPEGSHLSARDKEVFSVSPQVLGAQAAKSREGKVRLRRMKGLVGSSMSRWPRTRHYTKPRKDNQCFSLSFPSQQLGDESLDMKILATPIKLLSGGQTYEFQDSNSVIKTAYTSSANKSSTVTETMHGWELNNKLTFNPIAEVLTFEQSTKVGNKETTTEGSSILNSFEEGKEETVTLKKGLKYTCPDGHSCELQLWRYEADINANVPAIPAVDFGCLHRPESSNAIGTGPWQVSEGLVDATNKLCDEVVNRMFAKQIGKITTPRPNGMSVAETDEYYQNLQKDMCAKQPDYEDSTTFQGNISMDMIDARLGSWAWKDEGPTYYKHGKQPLNPGHPSLAGKNVEQFFKDWVWPMPNAYHYLIQDRLLRYDAPAPNAVEYLQNENWNWKFLMRTPSSTLQTSTVLVKWPLGDRVKKRDEGEIEVEGAVEIEREGATYEVLDEDIDLDPEHYHIPDGVIDPR